MVFVAGSRGASAHGSNSRGPSFCCSLTLVVPKVVLVAGPGEPYVCKVVCGLG